MTEELQLFQEDTEEQLQFMENALIDAQNTGIDDEKIAEIFRAMHTIKGTAGMFGFDNVVGFTHIAENLLDEIRKHIIDMTEDMITIFLDCKDHVQTLIDFSMEEKTLDLKTSENNEKLLKQLLAFMSNQENIIVAENKDIKKISENSNEEELKTWHISVRFDKNFFSTGMDILSILNFFNKMGELIINIPVIYDIPLIEDIKPLESYIGFELDFYTKIDYDEVLEMFEFVEDDVILNVFLSEDKNGLKKLLDSQSNNNLKNILIDEGIYAENFINDILGDFKEDNNIKIEDIETKLPEIKNDIKSQENKSKHIEKKSLSLRVDSSKIDRLINQISEMVIANAKISQISDNQENTELEEASTVMSDMLEEIRNSVMNIRMVQVQDSFIKFRRIVNDVAKKLGKDIEFNIIGGETELDKIVVEKISDPLLHMLRNSVDHGIETAEERANTKKNPIGQVNLRAYPDAGSIVIEIEDDGKGINKERLLEKAIKNGFVSENDKLSDKEICNLIFSAGLSTAEEVSDISGRGVGMDVVRRNIEELRGTIDVESEEEKGSKITIRLPLTLAIIDGFLIQAGRTKYILPLDMIQECIELDNELKENMKGNNFINLREEILPILDIRKHFEEEVTQQIRENIIVVRYGNLSMGLQVDELFGEHQTVIKPLGDIFENVKGISGGSILGSGEVALIFDIPALMEFSKLN